MAERATHHAAGEPPALEWRDIAEVLPQAMLQTDVLHLNRKAWAADGVIPFDRRVAIALAGDEAERNALENDVNMMLRSLSLTPRQRVYDDPSTANSVLLPRISQRAQKALASAVNAFDKLEAHRDEFETLKREGFFHSDESKKFVEKLIMEMGLGKAHLKEWCHSHSRNPRASDLWDCPGGVTGERALRLMRLGNQAAAERTTAARPGRAPGAPRGPRGAKKDDFTQAGTKFSMISFVAPRAMTYCISSALNS